MNELNQHQTIDFSLCKLITFIVCLFGLLLLYFQSIQIDDKGIFYIQLSSFILFCLFFLLGEKFTPRAFIVFAIIYQFSLSTFWYHYFWKHTYLLYNNADYITYINAATITYKTTGYKLFFLSLIKYLPDFSDWGYPSFLYLFYNIFSNPEEAAYAVCIGKAILYIIASWYLYKLSLFFLDEQSSSLVFRLWILSPVSIFFNGVNLKENVFVSICIFSIYFLTCFYKNKTFLSFLGFIIFTTITAFFRIYVTCFIIMTFILMIFFEKLIKKHFDFLWICIFIVTIVGIQIVEQIVPALKYFLGQSIGGKSGLSMPALILTAFISPVPSLSQNKFPDNYMVCGYSIFSIILSFFAIYEIIDICKNKKSDFYLILFLVFFNKLLVIISARSNEYRFQYPLVFLYFILMVAGYSDIFNAGGVRLTKRVTIGFDIIIVFIFIISLGITYIYNL